MVNRSSTTLTREALYAMVWERPLTKVAHDFGITGTGLKKICDRHAIPVPPRGYWAKLRHGKPAAKRRLRRPPAGVATTIHIRPTPPAPVARQSPPQAIPDIAIVRQPNRHPLIKAWRTDDDDRRHWAQQVGAELERWTSIDDRQMRILASIFKALEARGFRLEAYRNRRQRRELDQRPRGWFYAVDDEVRIECRLREKLRQVREPYPPNVRWIYPREWRQRLEPTGCLHFEIKTFLGRVSRARRQWEDKPDRPLEDRLGEIVAGILAAKPVVAEIARQHEDLRRRIAEEAAAAQERRREAARETVRRQALQAMAADYAGALELRQFMAVVAQRIAVDHDYAGRTGDQWLAWMAATADALDPLSQGPEAALSRLSDDVAAPQR